MKFLISLLFLVTYAHASPIEDCFKAEDEIDRKYCVDKQISLQKKAQATEQKTWAAGLSGDAKSDKLEALNESVQIKKEQIQMLQAEIAETEKHLQALSAVKETSPAAPVAKKKKKKEKKKGVFGIKL